MPWFCSPLRLVVNARPTLRSAHTVEPHVSEHLLTEYVTQLATELVATANQVVVTVDHAYQSGVIELDNHTVLFNLAGELIKPRESNYARVVDLLAVANHLYDQSNLDQSTWDLAKINPNETVVLGHGQGGMVAQMMVGSNIFSAGGSLDGLVAMPAPYTEKNVLWHNRTLQSKPKPKPTPEPTPKPNPSKPSPTVPSPQPPQPREDTIVERLKKMALGLRKTMMNSLSGLMCRIVSGFLILDLRHMSVLTSVPAWYLWNRCAKT